MATRLKDNAFAILALLFVLVLPSAAGAFPSFSRHVGRDCGYCHSAIPKLNDTGRTYLFNGYRFEAEGEWKAVKDIQRAPVSFEVEVEGVYDNVRTSGVRNEASDLKVEEAEVIAASALGKEGRVSALVMVAVQQANDGAFDAVIPKAFIQVNDLVGPVGSGRLNLKAGIDDVGLPFLRPTSTPISNAMLAETLIGAVSGEQRLVELNGSFTSEGERTVAHRYRAGVVREPVQSDSALKGFFASWAATVEEALSFGAIFRAGEEAVSGQDISYQRYGVAVEAGMGPFIVTAAWFATRRAAAADGDDWLVELLYFIDRFTFGGRYEQANFDGFEAVRSQTVMARYDILSSAYVQLEYRHREDSDRVAGGGELEDKARLMFTALY